MESSADLDHQQQRGDSSPESVKPPMPENHATSSGEVPVKLPAEVTRGSTSGSELDSKEAVAGSLSNNSSGL